MPVIVNDYVWTQNDITVVIKVPLKGINSSKVDIFTSNNFLKAHYHPYLFEAYLLHEIDNSKSECIIENDQAVFRLVKKDNISWEKLELNLNKQEKTELKTKALEEAQILAAKLFEEKVKIKNELDRYAVRQAMEIDDQQHKLIEKRRNSERDSAMQDFEQWHKKNIQTELTVKDVDEKINLPKIIELTDEIDKTVRTHDPCIKVNIQQNNMVKAKIKKIQENQPEVSQAPKTVKSEYVETKKAELENRVLPQMREFNIMEVKFTPRVFPTPTRESQHEEEQTWLKNVTAARRATGFVSEDLRPEEQDPQWCKDKGDEFFRSGNYLGAISAYTHGITLSDKLPSLFANRAATHFALGNFNKCDILDHESIVKYLGSISAYTHGITLSDKLPSLFANRAAMHIALGNFDKCMIDCSTALDLMQPACEANLRSRARCLARRAAALARSGRLRQAIDEMKAAAKLLPQDEKIKIDIYNMERAWEQNPDSD